MLLQQGIEGEGHTGMGQGQRYSKLKNSVGRVARGRVCQGQEPSETNEGGRKSHHEVGQGQGYSKTNESGRRGH